MKTKVSESPVRKKFRRAPHARGFTLVEVMIAAVIFAAGMVGITGALVQAYRISAQTRLNDEARAILRSVGDQFAHAQYADPSAFPLTIPVLLQPTTDGTIATPTGTGMAFAGGNFMYPVGGGVTPPADYVVGDATSLAINLGTGIGSRIPTTVTREVCFVSVAADGTTTPLPDTTFASVISDQGFLIRGTFRTSFAFMGRTYNQELTILRNVLKKEYSNL